MKYIIFLLPLLWIQWADAACGLAITANNVTIDWDLNFANVAIQMKIDKSDAAACSFGIGITKGTGASYAARSVAAGGSKTMRYQIYSDSGMSKIVKDYPDITSANDVIQGGFGTGVNLTQTVIYYLEIPLSLATVPSVAAQGTYSDTYTINVYEGSDPLTFTTPAVSTGITLTVNVPYMIALSMVDSGANFSAGSISRNVNFGTLSEGASATFDLRVRTNAGFSVTFSSSHNGYLHHTNPAKNSLVPYKFYVNSALLNMSSSSTTPVVGLTAAGQTSLNGLGYPIKIVIGSLSSPTILGGPHQDDITITATTTE
jgi:spore coat protein U-like protein